MKLVDAIVAVARTSAGWEKFTQKQLEVYASNSNFSELAEIYLYDLLIDAGRSEEGRVDYPWREHFILHFAEEARSGRCCVSGIVGLRSREKIPADLFESERVLSKLLAATSVEFNELMLPDGTPVVTIEVEFPNQAESVTPPAEETLPFPRHGPKPGEVRRYDGQARALFPELEELIRSGKSATAAATELAEQGKMPGPATDKTKANRLVALYKESRR